jgi:5-methyltetrahydrofolate--homocysteine methyltransferase
MNRIYIETHNVGVDVRDVNRAGAELARQAAGDDQYVLGDISSTGQMLEPYGDYKESEFYETFKEQAQALVEAGVDGFIIETMFDLREALCALRACKDTFSLPVIVSLAFATQEKGGRTMMGNSAEDCAKRLTEAGADVIGANCGDLDPAQMAVVVSVLKSATRLPNGTRRLCNRYCGMLACRCSSFRRLLRNNARAYSRCGCDIEREVNKTMANAFYQNETPVFWSNFAWR